MTMSKTTRLVLQCSASLSDEQFTRIVELVKAKVESAGGKVLSAERIPGCKHDGGRQAISPIMDICSQCGEHVRPTDFNE
jgi:hypothetical protein